MTESNGISEASKEEFKRSLAESTRGLISEIARDIRGDIANLDKALAVSLAKLEDLVTVIKPIPEQIVRIETQIEGLHSVQTDHWNQITKLSDRAQRLEVSASTNINKYFLLFTTVLIAVIGGLVGIKLF